MRTVSILLLVVAAAAAGAADETRAWKAVLTARATARVPADGRGEEIHEERVELLLVARPAALAGAPTTLALRKAAGRYGLHIDLTERGVTTRGKHSGALHVSAQGALDKGRCRLAIEITPRRLAALVTMSGMDKGRFATLRSTLERRPLLANFVAEGAVQDGVAKGRKAFVDRRQRHVRDVVIEWTLTRVDPELRGVVVDHLGQPVPGIDLRATTTNPERAKRNLPPFLRTGVSDAQGRFAIDAFWSFWHVSVSARHADGIVYAPRASEGWPLRFEDAPEKTIVVDAFRLKDLPDPHLLAGHFRGDVDRYLAHVRRRALPERLSQALAR